MDDVELLAVTSAIILAGSMARQQGSAPPPPDQAIAAVSWGAELIRLSAERVARDNATARNPK